MADYIDRDAAIAACFDGFADCRDDCAANIRNLPAADVVVRKTGKWINMGDFEQCSACKGTRLKEFESYYGKATWIKTPYCPNCGARMEG